VTIVIGVDDSPYAKAAVERVRRLPWPPGTRALVVSACPPVFVGDPAAAAPEAIRQLNEGLARYHKGIAEKAAEALRGAGLKAEALVAPRDPREALVETARAESADLIVVGSHGRTGIAKLLLGSVASYVVSHAPCNVLVVKSTES
jgi:nucleotide-binding universal stress UspA family protein